MAIVMNTDEEDLRYFSCIGDEEGVRKLITINVDINSRNSMNGWTALHWAAARGHSNIVEILLQNGASAGIRNDKGETPANVTNDLRIHKILGQESNVEKRIPDLPIMPSYLKYPVLPVSNCSRNNDVNIRNSTDNGKHKNITNDVILKVRLADGDDPDFIEIELDERELTIERLTLVCCDELDIDKEEIAKIRKLPNTVIRKDKDVQRLKDYQEIEIVLHNKNIQKL